MPRKRIKQPETKTGELIMEKDILIFQIICQVDFKFMWVPAVICAFDPKELKGKKRSDIYPVFR